MERTANYNTSIVSTPTHFKNSARNTANRQHQLKSATVILPMSEPIQTVPSVIVEYVTGGRPFGVAWPGPNVNSGTMIHGHFDSALPGQQVLVGFAEGHMDSPAVIAKYPYKGGHNEIFAPLHVQPFTRNRIGPTDQVLGSFTGAYIALRGTLPVPGTVEVFAPTFFNVNALTGVVVKTPAAMSLTAGAAVTVSAGATASFTAGAAITVTAGTALTVNAGAAMLFNATGLITLKSTLGGVVTPAVKGTQLNSLLSQILTTLSTHTHLFLGLPPTEGPVIAGYIGQLANHLSLGVKIT